MKGKKDLRSEFTNIAAKKLPRWMKARNDPESNFQIFLNHAVMRKVDEINNEIKENRHNRFLDLANEELLAMTFKINKENIINKADKAPNNIKSDNYIFKYKGKEIPITLNQKEFCNSYLSEKEKVYYDSNNENFYFLQPYESAELILTKIR
ncbi:MAG: hypothetical protein ACOCP8_07240 [archaeon]